MSIEKIMSKTVVTVEMNDPLSVIKHIFENTKFHHLLVVERGKLVGVISDRDLLRAISPKVDTPVESARDIATLNKKAHQIMSRKVITLPPSAGIYQAISIFNNYNVSCIPITDEDEVQKVLGILSWRDIFRALEENR